MYFCKYTDFQETDYWKVFGNAVKTAGIIDLNVSPVIIRAEDFKNISGNPLTMPTAIYDGHKVGSPANNVSYYYHFADASFGNMHDVEMQGIVNIVPATTPCQFRFYPRNQSNSWGSMDLGQATYHYFYKYINTISVINALRTYRRSSVNMWVNHFISIFNKYYFNTFVFHDNDSGLSLSNFYDPLVVDGDNPKGRLAFYSWTQGEAFIRSPGREYEDTDNPGILKLRKRKAGVVLPYNSAKKYIELNAAWVAQQYDTGASLKAVIETENHLRGKYLCTVTFDGDTDITSPPYYGIGINETEFSMSDGVSIGGYAVFPDNPSEPARRIGAVTDSEISFVEDMSGVLTTGDRMDIYTVPLFLIEASYPINETTPAWIPLPMSNDTADLYDPSNNLFVTGTKVVIGAGINNYHDPSIDINCTGIILTGDPCCFMDCCRIVSPVSEHPIIPTYENIEENYIKIEDKHDEGKRSIFEFLEC